jgi:hypothetical protein
MKKMTEKEAWLWLAEQWATARVDSEWPHLRNRWYCVTVGGIKQYGLCLSIASMHNQGEITGGAAARMLKKLDLFTTANRWDPYWWSHTKNGANDRVDACNLAWAMCR